MIRFSLVFFLMWVFFAKIVDIAFPRLQRTPWNIFVSIPFGGFSSRLKSNQRLMMFRQDHII